VIDTKLDKEDNGSIPYNCDRKYAVNAIIDLTKFRY
jgi:hypothetical protein